MKTIGSYIQRIHGDVDTSRLETSASGRRLLTKRPHFRSKHHLNRLCLLSLLI